MPKVSDKDGFILHGWMVTDLNLSGGDLFTFGLVYQFSQSKAGQYIGGAEYLSSWTGWTYKTAREHLKHLVELGLIEESKHGVCRVYKVSSQLGKNYRKQSVETTETLGKSYLNQSVKTTESNGKKLPKHKDSNIESKIDNKENNIGDASFSYYDALISLGVTPQTATDFLAVRKSKKALDTLTSFNGLKNQIAKSGMSAEDCIRIATENNWKGFKVAWLDNIPSKPADTKPKSFFERYK